MSQLFVAEIKDSEPQAVRSGVFLALARPQPSHPKNHRNWHRNRRVGPAAGVVGISAFFFWSVLPSVPTSKSRFFPCGGCLDSAGADR